MAQPAGLDERTAVLARLAALVALRSPAPAYAGCVAAALDAGATVDEVVGTLRSVGPLVGLARVVAAAPGVAAALGYDLDAALETVETPDRAGGLPAAGASGPRMRGAGVTAVAAPPQADQVTDGVQSQLEKSFGRAADGAERYPQHPQISAAARSSFVDGADRAYGAGIIAIVAGATLVYFRYPSRDEEIEPLARYQAEDAAVPVPEAAPADPVGVSDPAPAPVVRHEPRLPVLLTLVVAMAIPLLIPEPYSPGPRWLLPAVEAGFVVAIAAADPGRIDWRSTQVRRLRIALIVVIAGGAAWGTVWLAVDLVRGAAVTQSADTLLATGGLVWLDIVIAFGLVYWEFDSGGPGRRAQAAPALPDFAFPQHLAPEMAPPGWRPLFLDYLYLGYTDAIAFSPTDAMPLAHWAKLTMTVESGASLIILGLVVARAVNILA